MRLNWKRLKSLIPNRVRVKSKYYYEVLWSEEFWFDEKTNRKTYGITRTYTDKEIHDQIILNKNQDSKETVHTYWHEFLHAVSEHYDVNLTETQVKNLEKALPYFIEFVLTITRKKK